MNPRPKQPGGDDLGELLRTLAIAIPGALFFSVAMTLPIIIMFGFLRIFGFRLVSFWHAWFAVPSADLLRQLIAYFDGDHGLSIVSFSLVMTLLNLLIMVPSGSILIGGAVSLQRLASRPAIGSDWNAIHNRLSLLFGDDIEELALYERRILPAGSAATTQGSVPVSRRSYARRILRILSVCSRAIYVPISWFVVLGVNIAFFDAVKRAFEQNEAFFFPRSGDAAAIAPDRLGYSAASDWTLLAVIATTVAVATLLSNKARLTFQWPVAAIRNLVIALVCLVVVLKLIMPKPLLLFSASCALFAAVWTIFWGWLGRPVALRAKGWIG